MSGDSKVVSPMSLDMLLAGIQVFGLASDGTDLRDLDTAIAALRAELATERAAREKAERDAVEATDLANWYHQTQNGLMARVWAVIGRDETREDGQNIVARVTELQTRAEKAERETAERCAEIAQRMHTPEGIAAAIRKEFALSPSPGEKP